ncbi:helicase-exonuclease AddAB subunit AddA [Facklamia miroungae]|uniref:DNA 3'-5' helicase n=1 Tax=Facklamia miroungae TaxID=120956 RepID=A0A1G7PLM2_9LACT|nr:helicase-exonuclease AddAB subunit AddA [Facklamia miroungae]NKZ28730.1 helicase-exonuclease AddAB subunit AddA [Facklamia miroungae]SDF86270.1 DNA helicase/exodeoxyribonuclease V, subunit A [Facklamia miroungae]
MDKLPIRPANSPFNNEQWQAIHQRGNNILVAASAGSGKTTVLIERIMNHLLTRYAELKEVLVVTFTESAANEMKDRMEVRLKKAINQSLDEEEKRYLLSQINQLASAHIQTLHSFCLFVIQNFFYLEDINPAFNLLVDESQKEVMVQEVWESLIDQISQNEGDLSVNSQDYQDLLLRLTNGRDDQALRSIILDIYHFARANPEPLIWLDQMVQADDSLESFWQSDLYQQSLKIQVDAQLSLADRSYQDALSLLATCSEASHAKFGPLLQEEAERVAHLKELSMQKEMASFISQLQSINFKRWPSSRGKAHEEDLETLQVLKIYRDASKKSLQSLQSYFVYPYETLAEIEAAIHPFLIKLRNLAKLFYTAMQDYKFQEGWIDYSDLEHLTLQILAPYDANAGVRKPSVAAVYFQNLFQEVLVDEYQDINEIQAQILSYLSREKVKEAKGNLFMVGDVKQSIYGFRMAEPSLFLAKYRLYQDSDQGDLIILDKNYRSRGEVLNFTNYLFERLMDESFGEMTYGQSESLVRGNQNFLDGEGPTHYAIELLLHSKEEVEEEFDLSEASDLLIDKGIDYQAHLIAQDIQAKLKSGYVIYDKQEEQNRLMTFKDIVVLSPTKSSFAHLQAAFSHYHLPFTSQAIETYFQRQEIQLMLALLKLIDNPMQDIPLVAILKSFFVGLSDNDLALIRVHHPQDSFYQAIEVLLHSDFEASSDLAQLKDQVQPFFDQLVSWREYAKHHAIDELIWQIYLDTSFLDYVVGLDMGRQRQANLHAFYQKAQSINQGLGGSLTSFIHYIETMLQQEKDLAEPLQLDKDQNMIRAMTIHASKGSEFPVVYLINSNRHFNRGDSQKAIIATKHHGIGMNDYQTDDFVYYQSISKTARQILLDQASKAEELRVLYVALTRTEQKLILVGSITSQAKWEEKGESYQMMTDRDSLQVALQVRSQTNNFLDWIHQAVSLAKRQVPSVAQIGEQDFITRIYTQDQIQAGVPSLDLTPQVTQPPQWLQALKEGQIQAPSDKLTGMIGQIKDLMEASYPYQLASQTAAYQSVSELKRLFEEPPHPALSFFEDRRQKSVDIEREDSEVELEQGIHGIRYTQDTFEAPSFMQSKTLDAARIGTLNHYLMEQVDFSPFKLADQADYNQILQDQIHSMIERGLMEEEDRPHLYIETILNFLKSPLGQEMIQNADRLKREQAFSYLVPAKDLFANLADSKQSLQMEQDSILVHGVIDSYYVIPNQGFVLIDFKTDRYRPHLSQSKHEQLESLKDKYRYQLNLYKDALASQLKLPSMGTYIVALGFDQVIAMDDQRNPQ